MPPLMPLILGVMMSTPTPPTVLTLQATLKAPKVVEISTARLREAQEIAAAQRAYEAHIHALPSAARQRFVTAQFLGQAADPRWDKRLGVLGVAQGVDLELTLRNDLPREVVIYQGGDAQTFKITLTGPGAVACPFDGSMTMEFRGGLPHVIKPGGAVTLKVEALRDGPRGLSRWLLTQPGVYQAAVAFESIGDGVIVRAAAPPVTLTVVEVE
ncbi:hypothetical protein KKF91_05740 [Myxococcota bacterium]|nr:hypothetical protein [Myxococcota bacterium]MBU1430052.1 hypothetical protein [Myxococcota bacterium]MBU1896420.1 hypothetical protein [Myxococcota bacterium]